jgi:import inner membrane translocase subunit TIM23
MMMSVTFKCAFMRSLRISLGETPRTGNPFALCLWGSKNGAFYSTSPVGEERMMKFEDYRKMKKTLKWNARVAGVPGGLVAMAISSAVNMHFNPKMFEAATPEEIQYILGMDPIVFAAVCGAVSGLVGYVVGGALFNTMWKIFFPRKAKQVQMRDVDFTARLHRHRYGGLDQNKYDDDYYGDKVSSLSDYRQWIRQQQRKRETMEKLNKMSSANETTPQ